MQNYIFTEYWKKRIHFDFSVVSAHKDRGGGGKKVKINR